jgi:hypothetical protein
LVRRQLVDAAHPDHGRQLLHGVEVGRPSVDPVDDRDERTTVPH